MGPYLIYKKLGFRRRFIHYFLLNLARLIFWFIPYEVHGKENLPHEGVPTILASNHLSHIDSVFTAVAAFPVKRAIRFTGAADFMKKIIFRWTKYELAFPVGRGPVERERFIRKSLTLLENGETVGIYPEGGRSKTGRIRFDKLKVGAGWIAKLAGPQAKVVPVFVYGTNNIIPIGQFFRLNLHTPVRIYFGSPLELTHYYPLPNNVETSKMITREILKGILKERRKCLINLSTSY
ncbi:MAG: 1-acyl-sn-glycerol-3-phosphate acyltransferase [Candidatus Heimdallarchaeota archaeon]|nr:MAG: 1-acyl-sn-glycerol-3-phosphate acyltransferase [Candidatus Heimdallarchaeota archaeon]